MASILPWRLPSNQHLYDLAPRGLQRILVNAEALKRDWFRRYGDYRSEVAYYDPQWYVQDLAIQEAYQLERLRLLIKKIRQDVPYYRATLPDIEITSLHDLRRLPILEKEALRLDPLAFVQEGISTKRLWLCSTSGSTGTPLRYYHDRGITRAHQAVIDALIAAHGCAFGERRARFSGSYVAPYSQTRPPYWIIIDRYAQLQCSAYHLGPETYHHYLRALRDFRVEYGTGYATAWHLLASYSLETGEIVPNLRAIFTDSEGITLEQQSVVERAFHCPVFQTYGTGEVGQVAMQCSQKRYHILTRSSIVEILDNNDQPVRPGETGHIVVTDLTGLITPFIRYRTGDLATVATTPCTCAWKNPSWMTIEGRLDDRIQTPEGRWIGRLSHVMKPGVGIRESQIVQTALDRVEIRIVPDTKFDPVSMEQVVNAAHRYMGETIQVSWKIVDQVPRTKSGKLRHVVREITT